MIDKKYLKTIEEKYKTVSELEHILLRSGMYIGSVKEEDKTMFVYNSIDNKMELKETKYVPGLLKIIDEVISNSCDEYRRKDNLGLNELHVTISKNGKVNIKDNGGIPVVHHKEAGCYLPEFIFGMLRTSSNYNDDEDRTGIGTNGLGIKIANIFSTDFSVKTADSKNEINVIWKNNMKTIISRGEPKKSNKHYTDINFNIDFSKFDIDELSDEFIDIIEKRCIDAAAANLGLSVIFKFDDEQNGRTSRWKFKNFNNYISLFDSYVDINECITFNDDMKSVWVFPSSNINIGFVNGTECSKGTHIKAVRSEVNNKLSEYVNKKEKIDVTPRQVDSKYSLFMNINISNPAYNSQTKEELTTPIEKFSRDENYTFNVPDSFLNKVCKSEIIEIILDWYKQKSAAEDKAQIRKLNKLAGKKLLRSDKFINCTSKKREEKCLYIAEGASAVAGFRASRDPQTQACYEMRGVPLNCYGMTPVQIMKNQVFSDLVNIIGLKWGESNTPDKLNFNKIVINSDMDPDGNHIAGLLILFFSNFPELFEYGIVCRNLSPIIIAEKGKNTKSYYTMKEYKSDEKNLSSYTIKYIKGLGTLPNAFYKDMMRNPHYQVYTTNDMSNTVHSVLRHWFAKGNASERRETLSQEV